MKYVVRVQARPDETLSPEEVHNRLIRCFRQLQSPWSISGESSVPRFGPNAFTAQVPLTKLLGEGVRGFANYRMRSGLRDDSNCDDFLDLEFNPAKVDLEYVVEIVLPQLAEALDAYLGYVGDQEFSHIDFDKSRGVNRRKEIVRLYPATYLDNQLCQTAFALSAAEAADRLHGTAELIQVRDRGLLIVASRQVVSLADAERIHQSLAAVLRRTS